MVAEDVGNRVSLEEHIALVQQQDGIPLTDQL